MHFAPQSESPLSSSSHPDVEAAANSLSALDNPPRVGSRMARIAGQTCDIASVRSFNEAVSLSSTVSNSIPSRTDMIAMPWSPIVPETSTRSPGLAAWIDKDRLIRHQANPGSCDEYPVPLAAINDLGIAGDRASHSLHGRPSCIESTTRRRSAIGKPFFENEGCRKEQRHGTADSQVVHGAMHGQLADIAAGKKIGRTTKESVVKAIRGSPGAVLTLPALAQIERRLVLQGAENVIVPSGEKHLLDQLGRQLSAAAVSQEHVRIVCQRKRTAHPVKINAAGHGRSMLSGNRRFVAGGGLRMTVAGVVVIGGTRPFRRNHGRAERILGRALLAKRRAVMRLFEPLQNQPTDAQLGFANFNPLDRKTTLGIIHLIVRGQVESALWNGSDAPPLPVPHLKHFADQPQSGRITFPPHDPRILVVDAADPLLQHGHATVNPFEEIQGSNPVTTIGI